MKTSDKLISAITLGLPAPVILALLLWWGVYIIDKDMVPKYIYKAMIKQAGKVT